MRKRRECRQAPAVCVLKGSLTDAVDVDPRLPSPRPEQGSNIVNIGTTAGQFWAKLSNCPRGRNALNQTVVCELVEFFEVTTRSLITPSTTFGCFEPHFSGLSSAPPLKV